jgi:phosphoribosylformylglycinamidine (FGAM) synthase-like enzyme
VLFSESNSRLLVEVPESQQQAFESLMKDLPVERIGVVTQASTVRVVSDGQTLIELDWSELRDVWRSPLDFV